jgi:hypothetical protein
MQLNFRKEAEYAKLFANPIPQLKEVCRWGDLTARHAQKID